MSEKAKKNLIVVVGPTAVGKTALCIELSQIFSADIVSADSRQFYKEMAIGTAKPTPEELAQAPHHFVDSHSIENELNAGSFEVQGLKKIHLLFEKQNNVILTGGSGLYIQAICEGFDDMPQIPPVIRANLKKEFELGGIKPLLEELKIKDSAYFETVDQDNHQRVIRALEVIRFSNAPFSEFLKRDFALRPFNCIKVALQRPTEELYERINHRVDLMFEAGLEQEVRSLIGFRDRYALQTVGYKEVFGWLDKEYDFEECVRLLKRNTRRYAKRQMTWFRKDKGYTWFHPDQKDGIVTHISKIINHE